MWKPKLNPITRKRLRRFTSLKRAYYSLIALVALYVVSMVAELICNNVPLLVRYEGRTYYPILKYYPDDAFTGSGLLTRPNYKAIRESEVFSGNRSNWMLFPPIEFGPNEGITADDIDVEDVVRMRLSRKQLVGSVDVDADFQVRRSVAAAPFFALSDERALRGADFSDAFPVSDALRQAVTGRFANQSDMPLYVESAESLSGMQVELSLSPFSPRGREPATVRLSLRETGVSGPTETLVIDEENVVEAGAGELWDSLSEEQRNLALQGAVDRRMGRIRPLEFEVNGAFYMAEFIKEDVFFPFRPTPKHFMGLDSSGRDVFARILYAMRISLNFGLLLVLATMIVGAAIGGVQGYFGGKTDLLGQRAIEVWEALPFLYIIILMGSVFGRSFLLLLIVYGLFNWIGISYYMRGEFLKCRKQPYVEAAHCLGLPAWKIMVRHILPNSLVPIITFVPFALVSAIGALSALDYLGFGLPSPTPSWGELLAQAQEFRYAWWLVLYPSLTLFIVILLGVFIGEGIRAAFDPRVSSRFES